jgi:hypothetical protein
VSPKARIKSRNTKAMHKPLPLNFLLGCSQGNLASFELARLAAVADYRKQLHEILDLLIDEMSQAAIAAWFRASDRTAIKYAIENEETPLQMAARMVTEGQRSEDELIPLPSLPLGAAHLAASMRYQERNMAEGKCSICPEPLARNSVRLCEKHLAMQRHRMARKKGVRGEPGSLDYLYGEITESTHGRHPNSLAALATGREKQTRAYLAEMGIAPEDAALSLRAAKDALLKHTPEMKGMAKTLEELMILGSIPTRTTAQQALHELLEAGAFARTGAGKRGDPYRYFAPRP